MTEKVINAMLAGAIPIYFGPEGGLAHWFDPETFIDCSDLKIGDPSRPNEIDAAEIDRCVQRVVRVDQDDALYNSMKGRSWFKGGRPSGPFDWSQGWGGPEFLHGFRDAVLPHLQPRRMQQARPTTEEDQPASPAVTSDTTKEDSAVLPQTTDNALQAADEETPSPTPVLLQWAANLIIHMPQEGQLIGSSDVVVRAHLEVSVASSVLPAAPGVLQRVNSIS